MSLKKNISLTLGRATSKLPPAFNEHFWRILRFGKKVPISRLAGETHTGDRGSALVAGSGPVNEFIPAKFFRNGFETEMLEPAPVLKLAGRIRGLRSAADITVVRIDRALSRPLMGPSYLRVPEWLRSTMPVPPSGTDLAERGNSVAQDIRLIRKNGFTCTESHSAEELSEFYHTMFRPYTLSRHHSDLFLKTELALKEYWRRGALLWIMSGQERVAGLVVQVKKTETMFAGLGVRGDEPQLLKRGAVAACYHYGIAYAQAQGSHTIDYGATKPSLLDGVLVYKRKWGAIVSETETNINNLLTYWPVTNPSIEAFLESTPLIFRTGRKLAAVTAEKLLPFKTDMTLGLSALYTAVPGAPGVLSSFKRQVILGPTSDSA